MARWSWQTIVQLWIGALVASLTLIVVQVLVLYRRAAARNTKFFWLLPYPGNVAGVVALTRVLARHAPLAAVGVSAVLAVALALTLAWALTR